MFLYMGPSEPDEYSEGRIPFIGWVLLVIVILGLTVAGRRLHEGCKEGNHGKNEDRSISSPVR